MSKIQKNSPSEKYISIPFEKIFKGDFTHTHTFLNFFKKNTLLYLQ